MEKAATYVRVSTLPQTREGKLSLDNQKNRTAKYCENEGFELFPQYVFEDAGLSGAKDDRPQLQALLQSARRREFRLVIVNDITRFGRSATDLLNNVKLLQDNGINFHSVKDKIDLSTAQGRFFFHVISGMSEMELETIKIRMSEVKLAKLREGKIILGKLAYGYIWNDDTQRIEVNGKDEKGNYTGEAALFLRIVKEYVDLKKSLQDVAITLQKEGIPSREGKKWYSATIKNFFHKSIYCGITTIQIRETVEEAGEKKKVVVEEVPFECEPLLSRDRWQQIQDRLASGRSDRSGRPMIGADRFILRDLLKCGICGCRVGPRLVTSRGKQRGYYACHWKSAGTKTRMENGKNERCALPHIPSQKLDEFVYNYILFLLQYEENPGAESSFYKGLVSDEQYETRLKELE